MNLSGQKCLRYVTEKIFAMKNILKSMFVLAVAVTAASCGNENKDSESPDAGFADYIEAYTGGLISDESSVKIQFASTPDTSVPADGLFSFSPSLRGEVRWVGSRMIEFVPEDGQLKQGREYRGKFEVGKVFGVEKPELRTFCFMFRVAPKKAAISIDNVRILKSSPSEAAINGSLMLSESVPEDEASGMLYAEGAGAAKVSVRQMSEPGVFEFTCAPVVRSASDSRVTLVFDGHSSGFGKTVSADVTVPASEGFRVVSAKKKDGDEPYVEVVLSQPLDPLSDVSGMFTLSVEGRSYTAVDGNIVRVFFERKKAEGNISLTVSGSLKDCTGTRLGEDWTAEFRSDELKPAVRLPGRGNILPDASELRLPFRAVNLKAVDLRVIKIYSDNVLHFLQDNSLDGDSELRRSGRMVYSRRLQLDSNPQTDLHQWQNFSVDLSGLMKREPGAIYRISLSFRQEYSVYGRDDVAVSDGDSSLTKLAVGEMSAEDEAVWDIPYSYYYDNYYDWEKYDWNERDNPLSPTYYMQADRFPSVNLMNSNVGVIAKSGGNGKMWVYVSDIVSASPLSGVEISAYNYQLRRLAAAKSDAEGRAELAFEGKPFVVVAKSGDAVSYLKVIDGQENSLSRFDVGGQTVEKGLRGFVYGERGVWRPGDTMHLVLLVESSGKKLPQDHPAVLEVYGPRGQFFSRQVCPKSVDGFYTFDVPTSGSDMTGTYHAYAKIGGATFHKALHVETIKPNRLKVTTTLPSDVLDADSTATFRVSAAWLTGAAASSLTAKASVRLTPRKTAFKGFDGYIFSNPLSEFRSVEKELFSTVLDSRGNSSVSVRVPAAPDAPGMLNATIVTRVSEPGGNESTVSQNALCSPFGAYVGVLMPSTENGYLETDRDWSIRACAVGKDGRRIAGHRLEYRIYRLDSSWWWERDGGELASFIRSSSAKVHASGQIVSGTSDSEIRFRLDYPDWGNFLLYVTDLDSGHSSGTTFLCDWPQWRGRGDRAESTSASMLSFSLDRKSCQVGDEAVAYLPAAKGARALVSFENDSRVIASSWVEMSADSETPFRFRVTGEMAPSCYVHVTLLNPYGRTAEGQPLRLYGVQPLTVTAPDSRLDPVLSLPETIRPQEEFAVRVREKSGRPMSYTIAIVDEGLLDLTGFETPDPWAEMNRRSALGVRTWDIYNNVMGAYGTSFASMFSVGGDEDLRIDGTVRDNRFEPVVRFLGPFTLRRGENVHKVTLPMYVGSVRVMLVAARDGAFGSAEKTVPVRSPLMVLPTLPRTLATGEKVTMPVNVFAMEESVRNAEVTVSADGPLRLGGPASKSLTFSVPGDEMATFEFRTGSTEGPARVKVTAKSGDFVASDTVNIMVRNINPPVLSVRRAVMLPGESCGFECTDGANVLEVSAFPSIDVNGVWFYMKHYPHRCTEQLCAKGITLLSIMPQLDEQRRTEAGGMVSEILSELYSRQLSDGSFVYWPGSTLINPWADAMAGHFMTLASGAGFSVNGGVFGAWRNKVKKYVNAYRAAGDEYDELAAYSLYVLALSGNAQDGPMNRMKESSSLTPTARALLASAYAVSGRKSVAESILAVSSGNSSAKRPAAPSLFFGSALRDDAIFLDAQVLAGNLGAAMELAGRVADGFAKESYTTQTTAFASSALSKLYALTDKSAVSFRYECSFGDGGNSENVRTANSLWTRNVVDGATSVRLSNTSRGALYASLASRTSVPAGTAVREASSGISTVVAYKDMDGMNIRPDKLAQGTDFVAEVTVKNASAAPLRNLSLSVKVPSGWEIYNSRLFSAEADVSAAYSGCDIRDGEVLYYFDLPKAASRTYALRLSAAYLGEFVLPSVSCEAMYDNSVFARTASGVVRVVPSVANVSSSRDAGQAAQGSLSASPSLETPSDSLSFRTK